MFLNPVLAMHIPDGFLSVAVALVGWALMVVLVGLALRETRDKLGERQIPLMGILAAFIFAAQMINFPVAGGTSGHLLGGALAAILLGPWSAVLVMLSVISVQALLFQDGGLLALGFNTINMGVITVFVGYAIYNWVQALPGRAHGNRLLAAAIGAWVGVEVAAIATSLELVASGTSPLQIALPAMVGVHALIGVGEALITVGAIAFIQQTRPDLLGETAKKAARGSSWIAVGLLIALLVVFLSPLASPSPDGLERVAADQGFLDAAQDAPYQLLPDYTVPVIKNEALTTIAAGVVGVLVVAGIGYGVGRLNSHGKAGKRGHTV